jgi:hypothetical protein
VIVAVGASIVSLLRWLDHTCLLVIEDDVSHALERHLYPFSLLDHVFDLLQLWYRLRSHANTLIFMGSLTVNLREFRDMPTPISNLVQRRLKVKTVQMTFDRLSIWSQAGTVELLLFKACFSVVA